MSDPIAELIATLAALRRDIDRLAQESTATRDAALQAGAAALASQKAAEAPRPVRIDARSVGDALATVSSHLSALHDDVRALDAAGYRESVAAALSSAKADLDRTVRGIEKRLTATGQAMDQTVRRSTRHLTVKLAATLGAVLLTTGLTLYGFASASTWWQHSARDQIAGETERLRAELPQLQARVAEWEKRAGRATLRTCQDASGRAGTRDRLCAKIDPSAPRFGERSEYAILDGY